LVQSLVFQNISRLPYAPSSLFPRPQSTTLGSRPPRASAAASTWTRAALRPASGLLRICACSRAVRVPCDESVIHGPTKASAAVRPRCARDGACCRRGFTQGSTFTPPIHHLLGQNCARAPSSYAPSASLVRFAVDLFPSRVLDACCAQVHPDGALRGRGPAWVSALIPP